MCPSLQQASASLAAEETTAQIPAPSAPATESAASIQPPVPVQEPPFLDVDYQLSVPPGFTSIDMTPKKVRGGWMVPTMFAAAVAAGHTLGLRCAMPSWMNAKHQQRA